MDSKSDIDPEFCFPCSKCSLKFNTLRDLRKHSCLANLECVRNNIVKFELPKENDVSKYDLKMTTQFHQSLTDDDSHCTGSTQDNKVELKQNILLKKKQWLCSSEGCGIFFNSKKVLNRHKLEEHGIEGELSICSICKFESPNVHSLARHMAVHTVERNFSCDECGEKFKYERSIGKHKMMHQRILQKNLVCQIGDCKEAFKNKRQFHHHQRKDHRDFKKRSNSICKICDFDSRSKNNLARHMVKHTKEKQYMCHECDKSFAWENGLINHVKIHKNIYDYECDQCNKKFRQKGTLKVHKIVKHDKIYPFICPTCGEGFPSLTVHKRHMSIHTGEKKFKCTFCYMTFRLSGTRNKHELIHGDIRNFACNMCPKLFRASDHLKNHIKRHMNQRDYICKVCDSGFIEPAGLRRHKCLLA